MALPDHQEYTFNHLVGPKLAPLPRAGHQLGMSENSVTFAALRVVADRGKMTLSYRLARERGAESTGVYLPIACKCTY
jgi:hypothetical protein